MARTLEQICEAFVCQNMPYMIVITSSYGLPDLKTDLQYMYKRAGEKDEGVMFLFTDNQIANEKFFVFFNDLLASGFSDLSCNQHVHFHSLTSADSSAASVWRECPTRQKYKIQDNLWTLDRFGQTFYDSICIS